MVGEAAGKEGAYHSTNAMELEDVKTLIDAEPLVEILERRTDHRSQEPNDGGEPERYVASGGSDADKTSNRTLTSANDGEFALGADVVDENPAEDTAGGGEVCVE